MLTFTKLAGQDIRIYSKSFDCIGCFPFFPKNQNFRKEPNVLVQQIPNYDQIRNRIPEVIIPFLNNHFIDKYLLIGAKTYTVEQNYGAVLKNLQEKYKHPKQIQKIKMKFRNMSSQSSFHFSIKQGVKLNPRELSKLRQQIIKQIKKSLKPEEIIKDIVDNEKLKIQFVPVLDQFETNQNEQFNNQYVIRICVFMRDYQKHIFFEEKKSPTYQQIHEKYYNLPKVQKKHKHITCFSPFSFFKDKIEQVQQRLDQNIAHKVDVKVEQKQKPKKILIFQKNQPLRQVLKQYFYAKKIYLHITQKSQVFQEKTLKALQMAHWQSMKNQNLVTGKLEELKNQNKLQWQHIRDVIMIKKPSQFKYSQKVVFKIKGLNKVEFTEKDFSHQTNLYLRFQSKEKAASAAVVLHGKKIEFNFVNKNKIKDAIWKSLQNKFVSNHQLQFNKLI